jgi:hypothetical protein
LASSTRASEIHGQDVQNSKFNERSDFIARPLNKILIPSANNLFEISKPQAKFFLKQNIHSKSDIGDLKQLNQIFQPVRAR